MKLDRRQILALAALAGAAGTMGSSSVLAHDPKGRMPPLPEDAPKIAMLVFPGMVALDLINPMTAFKIARTNIMLVGKDTSAADTDVGVPIAATHTFADVPDDIDVLFVPGGPMGTVRARRDPETVAFVRRVGAQARWVTSVCTGSLLLGAAGLLEGYNATSHWTVTHLLPRLGANNVNERVVTDRNRMTGGGATAGLDFGLSIVARLVDEETAKRVQLILEYAPAPPFSAGTPEGAGPELVTAFRNATPWMQAQTLEAIEEAAARLSMV